MIGETVIQEALELLFGEYGAVCRPKASDGCVKSFAHQNVMSYKWRLEKTFALRGKLPVNYQW